MPQLADDDGLYFDISAVMNPDVHRFALETLGPETHPLRHATTRSSTCAAAGSGTGATYVNRTSYPFHFNREREPPEVEAGYTLYMYEALRAIKQACQAAAARTAKSRGIFHGNAERLIASRQNA